MPSEMKVFTIGYNRHNQLEAIAKLKKAGVKKVIDIRLWISCTDFLRSKFDYQRMPEFAPTEEIFEDYKANQDWTKYVVNYSNLMIKRDPLKNHKPEDFNGAALLCAEYSPAKCHRRLVAEILSKLYGMEVVHL